MKKYLAEHRLHINSSLEKDVIASFCSTQTSGSRKRILRTWFEGYIYSVTLGILKDRRVPLETGEKEQKATWSNTYLPHYEFLISHLLTKEEILVELNLLSSKEGNAMSTNHNLLLSHLGDAAFDSEEWYRSIFLKMKDICDEYMNGGLHYLKEQRDSGVNFVDELETLVKFLHP